MNKIMIEMPMVANCMANDCAYNVNSNCHAKAITIGNATDPCCDTFINGSQHAKSISRIAGIGACKTGTCQHNEDLECMAESVQIGMSQSEVKCMTFAMR